MVSNVTRSDFSVITATFTGPRRKSLFPKVARPAAPCATYCYHAISDCGLVFHSTMLPPPLHRHSDFPRQTRLVLHRKQIRSGSNCARQDEHFLTYRVIRLFRSSLAIQIGQFPDRLRLECLSALPPADGRSTGSSNCVLRMRRLDFCFWNLFGRSPCCWFLCLLVIRFANGVNQS